MDENKRDENQEFWDRMRVKQGQFVVEEQAPKLLEYFQGLKAKNDDDKYKVMILKLVEEINKAEDIEKVNKVIASYKEIVDKYRQRLKQLEQEEQAEKEGKKEPKDRTIILIEGSVEENKKGLEEKLEPVEAIYNFIDNLVYGYQDIRIIKAYTNSWEENSRNNPLSASAGIVSLNGGHANIGAGNIDLGQSKSTGSDR